MDCGDMNVQVLAFNSVHYSAIRLARGRVI